MRDRAFIVGGGPSLYNFNFERLANEDTICVNDSVWYVPNPTAFITMDFTFCGKHNLVGPPDLYREGRSKAFVESPAYKVFVVAFSGERLGMTDHGVIDRNIGLEYDLRLFNETIFVSAYGGIGTTKDDFRCGSESGYSAIQLAVVMGYKNIYLLGMDFGVVDSSVVKFNPVHRNNRARRSMISSVSLSTRTHFHTTVSRDTGKVLERKFNEFLIPYPNLFNEIKSKTNVNVFSCSPISRLNNYIKYVDIGILGV
jgi:hypothetical protein